MSHRAKVTGIALVLFVGNVILLMSVRSRRANSPELAGPQEWAVTLSERTAEDRARVLSTAFALDDFVVKPLEGVNEVVIPRPSKWFEELIISTSYVSSQADEREGNDSKLWRGQPVNVAMGSVCVVAYESEPGPVSSQVLVREKLVGLDTYVAKNGVEVLSSGLFAAGKYFVDDRENTLLTTQRAVQMNGLPSARYQADVPHWLFPARKLAVGESWVQLGALPDGISDTAPRPEAARKLRRLVVFEGRRAAEIETISTVYEFVPGQSAPQFKRKERTLSYLDLETGEPLWFENKSADGGESGAVVRGCNQIFVKHLIRTKRKA